MEEKFTGMMITLKKRIFCIEKDDTTEYQYLMFGHYDGMDIICTEQWYQLRPKGVAVNGGCVDIRDDFEDKYTLKLYFPSPECCESLENKGFTYDLWMKLGNRRERAENCKNILKKFPFISVAMINLSKKCVGIGGDLVERMQAAIENAASQTHVELSEIHCAIMPSVGYADFVLLFMSNNLKNVITILDCLRGTVVNDQEGTYPMWSNSYAISGFAKEGLDNLAGLQELNDVKLSIRVNLRNGVSASQFKSYFDEELKKICAEKDIKETNDPYLYQVFGNSDCLILSDMPFGFFVPLFYDEKLLNPKHTLFRSCIRHTRSSIRVRIEDNREIELHNEETGEIYRLYKEKYQGFIEKLKGFVERQDMPVRAVNGLQTVMKAYLSLVQFSHCFDIEKILGVVFEAMIENVEKTLTLIESDDDIFSWYSEQMMRALKIFRDKIEDYLADLRRSDRLFIEGQSLSHPSVGSATKLLFFYNQYINDMAIRLLETENKNEKIPFTFVVTSGGCDVTTAYDLFSYMDPVHELPHSLVIISIPEMSLYDIRGTMFRLLHECFHFCGERKRYVRKEKFLGSLSANSALVICNGLWESLNIKLKKDISKSLAHRFSKTDKTEIEEQCKNILMGGVKELQTSIEREIYNRLDNIIKKCGSEINYGRNLFPDAINLVREIIWKPCETKNEKSFLQYTYHEFLCCQKKVAEGLISCLKDWLVPFSEANIWKETAAYKLDKEQKGELDREEERVIETVFRYYTDGDSYESSSTHIETVEDVVMNLQDWYKECFADCMAAEILKLPVEDFILCFLYETWDYKKAFPDMFRIAIELKVCYGIHGELGSDVCKKIKRKVAHWEKRGFQYQRQNDYIEDVCKWINELLEEYEGTQDSHFVGIDFIEQYLQDNLQFYKAMPFEDVEKISFLSNMDSVQGIYELLKKVSEAWQDIAKERIVGHATEECT